MTSKERDKKFFHNLVTEYYSKPKHPRKDKRYDGYTPEEIVLDLSRRKRKALKQGKKKVARRLRRWLRHYEYKRY